MKSVRRLHLSLASRILGFQLAIILGALLMGAVVSIVVERNRLDSDYEKRALNVAQSVAGMPARFQFPPGMAPMPMQANRLNDQVLVRAYDQDWKDISH